MVTSMHPPLALLQQQFKLASFRPGQEAVIAALAGDEAELVGEAADVIFHLMVLLAEKGVALDQVLAELDRREGLSGLAEKAARSE